MRLKDKFKKVLMIALAAGITVNSIPLPSYAAIIPQTDSDMMITLDKEPVNEEVLDEGENGTGVKTPEPGENGGGNTPGGQEGESGTETEQKPGTEGGGENGTENGKEPGTEDEEGSGPEDGDDSEEETEEGGEITEETEEIKEEPEEIAEEPETEEEQDSFEKQMADLVQEAKDALEELLKSECIMALVYLCDTYQVMAEPDASSQTVARLGSGHTVLIEDVEVDDENRIVWYRVSFAVDDTVYTGYIEKGKLAYSNENFLAWEEKYMMPIEEFLAENGISLVKSGENTGIDGYSADVSLFPQSYRRALQTLKDAHPNWTFVKFNTGLDFGTVVSNQLVDSRSLIYSTAQDSFKGSKYEGSWYYATKEAVEYYLDPRNGFTENRIFQFEQLTFNSSYHNASAIQSILSSSFMKGTVPGASVSYAQAFYEIGESRGISPFHLASRVLQEQGVKGESALISGTYSGYEGYYNYFNIGASGSTAAAVIKSGLARAKSEGWNTHYKSLSGGAKFIGNGYILQGQDTLYLQKWDVESSYNGLYWHQYMQNIQAPTTESSTIRSLYNQSGSLNSTFVFKIPVYNNMPGVTVTPTSLSLKGGHTDRINYTGNHTDELLLSCSSSDTSVATVAEDGEIADPDEGVVTGAVAVTAVGPGTATIVLTFSDGVTASCTVTVEEESLSLSAADVVLNACSSDGTIEGSTAEIEYAVNNVRSGIKSLEVSDTNVLVATEKENGTFSDEDNNSLSGIIRLKGLAPGTAAVTVTSQYGSTAAITATVVRLPESVEIITEELPVSVGDSKVIHARVLPEDTSDKTVTWTSSDADVVKVNPTTGRITAVGSGTATITAAAEENSLSGEPVIGTCTVRVLPFVSSVEMTADEIDLLLNETVAETFDMGAKVYLSDSTLGNPYLQAEENQIYDIVYKSSDETIVTVDEAGKVTAVGIGSAIITAVVRNESSSAVKTASCKVNVIPERKEEVERPSYGYIRPEEIKINHAETGTMLNSYELTTGGYVDVNCMVLPAEADVRAITWTSSNENVAKVSENTDGTVRITAGTKGNAVITAAADIGIRKQISISVKEKQRIEEVTLNITSTVLYVNGFKDSVMPLPTYVQLTASPKSQAESDIVYKWTSTNEEVATVDENGRVTAVSPGVAVIMVEDTGGSGKYAKCTVTVERCLEEVRTNVEEIRLQPGKKVTLQTLLSPTDATVKNLEWESLDETIASVTPKGVVTVNKKATEGMETSIIVTDTVTGLKREISVTVTGTACAGVKLYTQSDEAVSTATLYQNGTQTQQQLTIKASGYNKNKEIIEDISFYATSSNAKIAVVEPGRDERGEYDGTFQITAMAKGSATIKVYAADGSGKSADVKITVKVHPESVNLSKDALYLKAGGSGTMSASVMPAAANEKGIVWRFADGTSEEVQAAFVLNSTSGKVTVAKGTEEGTSAEFVAVSKDGNIVSGSTCKVTVVGTTISSVKLSASSLIMNGDDISLIPAQTLTAALSPAAVNGTYELKAVSSNENVAVVEQNRGENGEYDGTFKITPTGYGTTTITVQTLDNSKKAACKVYVSAIDKAYKLSAVSRTLSIQSYASDINSSCTLQIQDQFGNILDNSLFTFTSNKPNIAVVDGNGVVTPNKAYEATKNSAVTITAVLTGDPYNRKVSFTVNILAKAQAGSVSVTVKDIRGEDLTDPESISVKYPIARNEEGKVVNTIVLTAQTMNVYGEVMDTRMKWTVSDTSMASVKADAGTTSATLTVKKAGRFYVTCTADDTLKESRRIQITAIDAKPVLQTEKLNLNQQAQADEDAYVQANVLQFVENKDSHIQSITVKEAVSGKTMIDPAAFKVNKLESGLFQLSVKQSVLNGLKTGNYKTVLLVETQAIPEIDLGEGGRIVHEMPITISVVNKKMSASIKTVSINRQNITELEAALTVTASAEVEAIELTADQANKFDSYFEIRQREGGYVIALKDTVNYSAASITGKAEVKLKGYTNPVTVTIKVNTPLTKAAVVSETTPSMDVRDAENGGSQSVLLYNKTTKQNLTNYKIVEVPENAKLEIVNAVNADGSQKPGYGGTVTLRAKDGVKYSNGGTVTVIVKVMALTEEGDDMWASPVDAKITVKTYTSAPAVNLGSNTLTLNVRAPKEPMQTTMAINRSNVRIVDDKEWEISLYDSRTKKYTVVKKAGVKPASTGADIVFTYNRQGGMLRASVKDGAQVAAGSYKYRIAWTAEDDSVIYKDVTVSIIDKEPSAKISAKGKLDLLTRSSSTMQGTISLSNTKSSVKAVTIMEPDSEGNYRRSSSFYSTWLEDNTFRIKVLEGARLSVGKKTVPVRIVLAGGTVLYTNVSFTVSQSTPKVTIPKTQTIYKSGDNVTVVYDMEEQIPAGYEISTIETVSVQEGIGVVIRDDRIALSLTDRSLKPGTYSIKINMYFKGAQYVFGSDYGKALPKTLKVTIKE